MEPTTHQRKQIMTSHARSRHRLSALFAGTAIATLVLAGCSTVTNPLGPATSANSFDAATAEELDRILDSAVTDHGLPGVQVGIWSADGDYVSAAGLAKSDPKSPMTTDMNHRIGSVTKTFTITALLRLIDAGKASLDDPIDEYVPGMTGGDQITLRHLAGMTSGIPDYSQNATWVAGLIKDPHAGVTPDELIAVVKDEPLHFEPGSTFEYSNTNTILIGLVIEKITGQPLADVVLSEVTKPLELRHTFLPLANEFPEPHAEGRTQQTVDGSVAEATDWNPSWGWAAGAMISDLQDLRIWAPALATGELLSPEMQQERLTVTPFDASNPESGYGLGLFRINGWVGHNGSLPGYKTVTIYLPEKQMTLVALVNSDIDEESDLVTSLLAPITELLSPDNVYNMG